MSLIDYGQSAEDHQTLLFLVRHTGPKLSFKSFNRIWERINKLTAITIPGQKRRAWVNFKRGYPKENNEWGDFQAHRKTLGLVSVGECSNPDEFEELFDNYRKVKEEYAGTLYNSRLFVFGMNPDGSPLSDEQKENLASGRKLSPTHSEDSGVAVDLSPTEGQDEGTKNDAQTLKNSNQGNAEKVKNSTPKPESPKPENPGVIFIKPDKSSKGDAKNSKDDAKNSKEDVKRSHSNSLTKENTGSEVVFYPSIDECVDIEEKIREFVASIFFVLEGKRLDRSFEKMDKMQLLCAPFEKKDYVGLDTDTKSFRKKCQGRLRKHLADLCLQAGLPGEAILHYQTAIDILKPVNDALWIGACFEGLCSASVILIYPQMQAPQLRRNYSLSVSRGSSMIHERGTGSMKNLSNGLSDMPDTVVKTALNPDDIIEKYKEALMHYSKFKGAGIIEIEASLKACRVLNAQRKYLQASDFLQNVVYINLQTTDEDKINRYCTLSQLYSQIGFKRKACFFKRIAAMQCVAPNTPQQNWHQCYKLLMQALDGYKITLDPKDIPEGYVNGWPVLQSRVLNELIFSSRKMGNLPVAVRHTTYLLHMLYDHLSVQERKEIASTLDSLTARCEGTSQSLALENGVILPPVPLTHIPFVKSFKLVRLQPHLEPVKLGAKQQVVDSGPFIFTPLAIGQNSPSKSTTTVDFSWVAKDICEVQFQLYNPMPDELKICQMGLLTEGVEVEMYPTNLCIPAESAVPNLVKILSRPKTSGTLNILGYFTHLLGVKSNCKLKDLTHLTETKTSINIIPSLPQIQLTCSLPKAVSFTTAGDGANVVTSGTTSLHAGQSYECLVTLQNTSNQLVERVDVSIDCKPDDLEYLSQIFQWSCENLESQLPLQPSSILCFTVCIYGLSTFLPIEQDSLSPSHSIDAKDDVSEGKCIESLLRVEYSGDEGLKAGYCRRCAVAFSVDVLPSVIFKRWDVLPAESCDHCYLVFDLHNLSSHTMQIYYSNDDFLVYEPNQIRRIAVKIERCIFPVKPKSQSEEDPYNTRTTQYRPTCHCSTYLGKFVDIRWTISATQTNGKISIDYLTWTEDQLALISVAPLSWDIKLNGNLYTVNTVFDHNIGDILDLEVLMNIKGDIPNGAAIIDVDCCQECYNSQSNHSIQDKVSYLGSNTVKIPKIEDHNSFTLRTSFLFNNCGLYKLNVKCTVKTTDHHSDDLIWKCSPIQVKVIDNE